jgi:hypothetical protein
MASYFRQIPNFEYVSRLPNAKISDYIAVKNLFKKGKLREDIFQDTTFFEKYQIEGDERPDNVADKIYGDPTLDWVVLLSNNILNIQTEWPMSQQSFENYLLSKYSQGNDTEEETYDRIYNGVHHYETTEVTNSQGIVIVPAGLTVDSEYSVSFYDFFTDTQIETGNISVPITNYDYEENLNNNKRNIYLLKAIYLNVISNDMEDMMRYEKGSTQYVSENLKRADNIRLYS